MRIKLIANPISGGDARPRIQQAKAFFESAGADVEIYLTTARGDARQAAAKALTEGYDRIVVAGGDGTLNEVVNGVTSPDLPVAFLPFGTVNVFALETGIPMQLEAACKVALHGIPRQITVGRINGERFLLMASSGWDAEAVAKVRSGLKRLIGRVAYAVSALEVLLLKEPEPIDVVLPDETRHRGFGVVVSNCRYYGGRYVVTPEASLFHDQLELCLLKQCGRLAMLRFAVHLLLKRPLRAPLVDFVSVTEVELHGDGVAVQVDGDPFGELPVRITVEPAAVAMVLPALEATEL